LSLREPPCLARAHSHLIGPPLCVWVVRTKLSLSLYLLDLHVQSAVFYIEGYALSATYTRQQTTVSYRMFDLSQTTEKM